MFSFRKRGSPVSGRDSMDGEMIRMLNIVSYCQLAKRVVGFLRRGKSAKAMVTACEVPPQGFTSDTFVRIRSDMRYVSPVRAMIDAACGGKLSDGDREDLKLAVGEAVCNAIEHGSPHAHRDFVCIACAVNHDGVTVSISDSGGRFTQRRKRREEKLHERGYGLLLIRKLTSAVHIKSNGHGATVILEKRCSATT
jgi:anti-sigma regulatory factor (Ser/Thr protein kinase)